MILKLEELDENVSYLKNNGKAAINQYLNLLALSELNEKQEVILIEVLLRTIEADQKHDSNEIKFLQMVKSRIKTSEETLVLKFPKHVDYLMDFNKYEIDHEFYDDIKLSN